MFIEPARYDSKFCKFYKKILQKYNYDSYGGHKLNNETMKRSVYTKKLKTVRYLHISSDMRIVETLEKYCKPGLKFLDIGCGHGNILELVQAMGCIAKGVEINKKLINPDLDIINGNILDMEDYSFLKEMDIIYMYRPMLYETSMNKLFDILYEHMKKDAVIIYNYTHLVSAEFILKFKKFEEINVGYVFKKRDDGIIGDFLKNMVHIKVPNRRTSNTFKISNESNPDLKKELEYLRNYMNSNNIYYEIIYGNLVLNKYQ